MTTYAKISEGLSQEDMELALSQPRPEDWLPDKIEITATHEHPYCTTPLSLKAVITKKSLLEASFDTLLQCMWRAVLINDYRLKNNVPKITKEQILEVLEK